MGVSIRKTVEAIQSIKHNRVNELYERAVKFYGFVQKTEVDDTVMFIFPDGRLLGAPDKKYKGRIKPEGRQTWIGLDRDAYHANLTSSFDFSEESSDRHRNTHPLLNTTLAVYYNVIIVAGGHMADTIHIPNGVEPTRQQLGWLRLFKDAGYEISDFNRPAIIDASVWDSNM